MFSLNVSQPSYIFKSPTVLHRRGITLFTSYSLIYGFEYINTCIFTVEPQSPSSETPSHTTPPQGGPCVQTPFHEPRAGPYAERDLPTTCPEPLTQDGKTRQPRVWQRQNRTAPTPPPTSGLWDHPHKLAGTTSARPRPDASGPGAASAALGGAPARGWGATGVGAPPLYSGCASGRSPSGSAWRRGGGAAAAVIVRLGSVGRSSPTATPVSVCPACQPLTAGC